jgi:hypothetical protein
MRHRDTLSKNQIHAKKQKEYFSQSRQARKEKQIK